MKLKNKSLEIPLIQGGMGVGVSLGNLAGHVSKCGGMGVISTADIGFREDYFWNNHNDANNKRLRTEIQKARQLSCGNGLIAINAMVATKNYEEAIKVAVEEGIDCIISGAGLPINLPELIGNSDVAIAPIVSSGKAAKTICRLWDKRYGVAPDFIVIEGSEAGGHLGFNSDQLISNTTQSLSEILSDVLSEIVPFETKYNRDVPIFVAGGIYTSSDIMKYLNLGADGVQVGTRFIATYECDAADEYKQRYIDAKKDDIEIVASPVGMPGRALRTPLITKVNSDIDISPARCINCLVPCKHKDAPYCITEALIEAVKGNYEDGLFFCGSNAWRIDKIIHVDELIDELMEEWRSSL